MKKMTIKTKITLWFTICMLVLAAVAFLFIRAVSRSTTTHQLRAALTELVDGNMQEVEFDDGELDVDDDFVTYKNGIYCLIFLEDGEKYRGYSPYEQLEEEPFEDGSIRTVKVEGETCLIYDREVSFWRHESIWVRGIALENADSIVLSSQHYAVLIALPLLILLAAIGGYRIARRAMHPLQKISETAERIGNSGDLSSRIDLNENGDELHQLAGTFNRMFDRLQENFEAEQQFTADASHELRTPVTTILAQCEYAFENASGEEELYEIIGKIQKQGYRMSHLIESLLYFTRLEQRTEAPQFETIDLSKIVSAICQEQSALGGRNITLTAEITPGIRMQADSALITRMLENLIRNAYRYGREDGYIRVRLEMCGNKILLSVADNGIGISAEELPKIWNRFYRADKARTYEKGAGLGLGLSMVKQIVTLHGGTIRAESKPDQGTTFTAEFQ